eukprot:scaffold520819_cov20-Prasinocladus_malaysianus.AAC.3
MKELAFSMDYFVSTGARTFRNLTCCAVICEINIIDLELGRHLTGSALGEPPGTEQALLDHHNCGSHAKPMKTADDEKKVEVGDDGNQPKLI